MRTLEVYSLSNFQTHNMVHLIVVHAEYGISITYFFYNWKFAPTDFPKPI